MASHWHRNISTDVEKTSVRCSTKLRPEKHLHGRGEDRASSSLASASPETPPRTWRRRSHRAAPCECGWKHLHGRGEDSQKPTAKGRELETPPRTWRRLCDADGRSSGLGNTSTDVEKTPSEDRQRPASRKHLHGRGEDSCPVSKLLPWPETPPRTWRRLGIFRQWRLGRGNTSTDVEKTDTYMMLSVCSKKHLHGRGEDPAPNAELQAIFRNTSTDVEKTHHILINSNIS